MGTFENIVLGEVKGKVGGVIGRRRGKKFFIYAAPKEVKISYSSKAIQSRNKLNTASKFGSIVNSIPELKSFWLNSKTAAFDAFHKIEKVNYHLTAHDRPTLNNTIVPVAVTDNKIIESSVSPRGIKLKIFISKIGEPALDGANGLTVIGVICYYDPKEKEYSYYHLSKTRSNPFDVKTDEQIEVEIPFSGKERDNYNSYMKGILYLTMVSKDGTGIPLKYFGNYRSEFTNENTGEKERFAFCDSRP